MASAISAGNARLMPPARMTSSPGFPAVTALRPQARAPQPSQLGTRHAQTLLLHLFKIGRDDRSGDPDKRYAARLAPAAEEPHHPAIRGAGVPVRNARGEELQGSRKLRCSECESLQL